LTTARQLANQLDLEGVVPMGSYNDEDFSVIRDETVTSGFLDRARGVLPACVVCNKPSAYVDLDGQPSHQICSGESTERKRRAKLAARGYVVRTSSGQRDLASVLREVEKHAAGPRAVIDQGKTFEQRRAETMAHIRSTQPPPARRSPELIAGMTERSVYDLGSIRTDPTKPDALRGELIDRARRANDLAHYPTAGRDQERVQDHVDWLLRRTDSENWNGAEVARRILATGSEAYKRAFVKIINWHLRGGIQPFLTPEETRAFKIVQETRALAVGVGSTGGFAVPYVLDQTLAPTGAGSRNPFRELCRVESISGSNEWRSATSGAMTAAYSTEAAVTADQSATLAQKTLTTVRATAFAPVSLELAEDWSNMLDQLGTLIQSAKNDLEAVKFAVGSGTNEPEGLITGATNVTNVGATFDVTADLYLAETNLAARFRPNAQWFGNRAIYQLIRQFAQPETAAPIIDHEVGGQTEVINYLANEASGMTSAVTSGSKILVLVDPSYYVVVDRIGLDLEVTTPLFTGGTSTPSGQRGVLALWRNTGKLLDPAAARVLAIT
jgi:HK97 family phage major capsid protein